MVLPLVLGVLLGGTSGAVEAADVGPVVDEQAPQKMLLQLKIQRGGKTLKHPGHMTESGSEIILVLTEGKVEHEVSVYIERADKGYKAEVKYDQGGKTVLEDTTKLKDKGWVTMSKGKTKVSLRIDTSAKRPDEIDMPGGKDPLDGLN